MTRAHGSQAPARVAAAPPLLRRAERRDERRNTVTACRWLPARRASHIRRVLILWVVLSVIGVAATVIIFPLINPTSASAVSSFANTTNMVFTALAMPVVMFVLAFVVLQPLHLP